MVWLFIILQIIFIHINWWAYNAYYMQPKYNHPAIFWNPLARKLLLTLPWIGIIGLIVSAFFFTDHQWPFLLFTITWWILIGYRGYKKSISQQTSSTENEDDKIERMDTAVCRMINLRLPVDQRLSKEKNAKHWPLFKVWQTTEAMIANAVEFSEALQDDGYTEEESIQKLLSTLNLPQDTQVDLISYLRLRLEAIDPEYLSFGILDQAVSIAKKGAKIEIENRKKAKAYPPAEWLQNKIPYEDISSSIPNNKDCIRLQLRMKPGDEIWTFSTPSGIRSPWHVKGLALIRQEEAIDHAITDEMHVNYADQ